ncbi:HMG box-containing protein 4-like isoform X2 [Limulus polyphemus]|uniref:HMG box-containing protein 4-like isoform X2 n=1 Tax=Limulus polyphemus TaxID=6850 RepID=A0ABM1TGW8_LIMPO|nr:HMG box-containing protein 4-like isoform X2 [Limulus polyphemus]
MNILQSWIIGGSFSYLTNRPSKVRPMSAYMLWCRENRKRIVRENPQLDFHLISKKMGAVWQSLSAKEKMAWKRKAKQSAKLQKNALAKGVTFISTGKSGSALGQFASSGGGANRNQSNVTNISSICDPKTKLPRTTPLDVAAHLKLLGDSLSIIGQRLTEHEGQIAVSGTLSVLLDSTLCALGPLMCLTSQVPELNGCEQKSLAQTLDNIAYVMPGL